ncbi:MAG: hypothetical protein R3B93_19865 [Bacteroidia bacterium]
MVVVIVVGQKHDVVVVNFLNVTNAADQRVYQLLDQKFRLFNGVFGSSDEVLGSIGSGVDFEKRIANIYQNCRTPEEIQTAFNELQEELRPDISERMDSTRKKLLENFDEEVREKLRDNLTLSQDYLNRFEQRLWDTTKYFLKGYADFNDEKYSFRLRENPFDEKKIHPGPYMILKAEAGKRKSDTYVPQDTNIYRSGHPLAQRILNACKKQATPVTEVVFDYSNTPTKVTALEPYLTQTGWLRVMHLGVSSFEKEDYILLACMTDDGQVIEGELTQRLFSLQAIVNESCVVPENIIAKLEEIMFAERAGIITENATRNKDFFDTEIDKLDLWADDMKLSLEKEIRDLDAEIKLKKSEAKKMLNLETKVRAQRQIKELEKKRSEKRQTLFEAQDQIDDRKEQLLQEIEARLNQKVHTQDLFTIKWRLI